MSVYQISLIFWQQVTIGEEAKSKLMETLSADVDFLTKLHLMDYSLLLGKYIYLFSHAFFFSSNYISRISAFHKTFIVWYAKICITQNA